MIGVLAAVIGAWLSAAAFVAGALGLERREQNRFDEHADQAIAAGNDMPYGPAPLTPADHDWLGQIGVDA